jgi:hypothetical protein
MAVFMPGPRWNTGATDSAWADTFNCFSTLSPGADRIIRICFLMDASGLAPPPRNRLKKSVTREAEPITPFGDIWEKFQHGDHRPLPPGKKPAVAHHRPRRRINQREKRKGNTRGGPGFSLRASLVSFQRLYRRLKPGSGDCRGEGSTSDQDAEAPV